MIKNINIPIEIYERILNNLDYKDILNFSITSTENMEICTHYTNTSEFYIRSLNEAQYHFNSVQKIVEFVTQHRFSRINIEHLNLSYFKHEIDDESFTTIIEHIHLVGTLTIHNVSVTAIQTIGHRLTSLQKLVWKLPETETKDSLYRVLNFTYNINLNELEESNRSSNILSTLQFQQLPNLKKLIFDGNGYHLSLLKFTAVEMLHLKNNAKIKNNMLILVLGQPNLNHGYLESPGECPPIYTQIT